MGTSSSKFKKYLQHGDEYAAMQVYQNSSELRKNLHPNFGYGDHHQHNTPIHYASRHGMKHLIRAFLSDLDGNPNKRNGLRQTSLHAVCQVIGQQKSPSALERRSYSVMLLLSWRGPMLPNGQRERIDINAQDAAGYTALHYAAQSGLKRCVEYLIAHGANVFLETLHERLTACDLAMRENHHEIGLFLESKMTFNSTPESLSVDSSGGKRTRNSSLDAATADCSNEVYSGLRAQDLQEAKDQLLVETADLLHVPLFTAESLLRHSEWSREILMDKWVEDPITTCKLAGVEPPSTIRRRPMHLDEYQELQMGSHPQHRQRHIVPTLRLNITKQPSALMYSEKPSLQHIAKTLPSSVKDKLPIFSSATLTKAAHVTNKVMGRNISQVPKNDQSSISSTTQLLQNRIKPKMIHSANSFVVDETLEEDEILCELCCDLIDPDGVSTSNSRQVTSNDNASMNPQLTCGHSFCSKCWKNYLDNQIGEAKSQQIFCPGYECNTIVPIPVIDRYISPKVARKSSVSMDANDTIRWCPYPACQRAVKLPEVEKDPTSTRSLDDHIFSASYLSNEDKCILNASSQSNTSPANNSIMCGSPLPISHAIDCGGGHFFCWECGSEAHAPLGCTLWKTWLEKSSVVNSTGCKEGNDERTNASSLLWLVTNSKTCPACNSSVEKLDGCNHVQCVQCRHEFCWVCLDGWKKHGVASGSHLKCNQFPISTSFNKTTSKEYARNVNKKDDGLYRESRFIHYYVRYKNHENSSKMEKPLLYSAKRKREILQLSLSHELFEYEYGTDSNDTSEESQKNTIRRIPPQDKECRTEAMTGKHAKFYTDSVWELIKARLILCSSYAYGYYLYQNVMATLSKTSEIEPNLIDVSEGVANVLEHEDFSSPNPSFSMINFKTTFEIMQCELEEITEVLSEMIARPYLRTPRRIIIQTLQLCRRKRHEFLLTTYRGPLPLDTDINGKFDTIKPCHDSEGLNDVNLRKEFTLQGSKNQSISRKPLMQINTRQINGSETLPGRFRSGQYHKKLDDDPWLVKENVMNSNTNIDTNHFDVENEVRLTKEDLKLTKDHLRSCRMPECATEFRVRTLQNVDDNYHPYNCEEFCSLKCYKGFDEKASLQQRYDSVEFNVVKKVKVEVKDIEKARPSQDNSECKRVIENMSQPIIETWNTDMLEEFSFDDSPYHVNIGQHLYTLPRTSRSDDNLLLEDKPKSNISNKAATKATTKVGSSMDPNEFEGKGEITMNLESKSMSTDGLETNTVADETVNSFLKSLAMKEDSNLSTKANDSKNLDTSPALVHENSGKEQALNADDFSGQTEKKYSKDHHQKINSAEEKSSTNFLNGSDNASNKHISRKYLHQGHDKRLVIRLLKRSWSTGEINHSGKKTVLGSKASHHKKSRSNKGSGSKSSRTKLLNEVKSPIRKGNDIVQVMMFPNGAGYDISRMTKKQIKNLGEHSNGKDEHIDIKNAKRSANINEKKQRPKFGRQKAFDIDSDGNDDEASKCKKEGKRKRSVTESKDPINSKGSNKIAEQLDPSFANYNEATTPQSNITAPEPPGIKASSPNHNAIRIEESLKFEKHCDPNSSKINGKNLQSHEKRKTNSRKRHPGLTIKIHNSSMADDTELPDVSPILSETNELFDTLSKELAYSPTLHISGIAISRSPGGAPLSASTVTDTIILSDRNRSASLVVPPPTPQTASLKHVGSKIKGSISANTSPRSPGTICSNSSYLASPNTTCSATPNTPSSSPYKSCEHQQKLLFTFPDPPSGTPEKGLTTPTSKNASPSSKEIKKSPRSPVTTRMLSSVLLVQESCLSSDDFHEALFLDKKSPNKTLNKKKRRSRKKDSVALTSTSNIHSSHPSQTSTATDGINICDKALTPKSETEKNE